MGFERATCLVRTAEGDLREVDPIELGRLDDLRAADGGLVWLNVVSPTSDDIDHLSTKLGLHPLAVEDLEKRRQRPKLDTYPGQHVIVAYEVLDATAPDRTFDLGELHLIAGASYLVSVHWTDSPALGSVRARYRQRAEAVGSTIGGLVYSVLDEVADGYFPLLDKFSDEIDRLEDRIVGGGPDDGGTLRDVLRIKRGLLELRRVVAPLRDVANAMLRRDMDLVDDETAPYFQDLYDHLVRVQDGIDLYRDLLAAAMDANLSVVNNTLNVVVKRLTAFTVILMVPTLIAGIYGMNFDVMPELRWPFGYFAVLGLMAAAMLGAWAYFRSRNWF